MNVPLDYEMRWRLQPNYIDLKDYSFQRSSSLPNSYCGSSMQLVVVQTMLTVDKQHGSVKTNRSVLGTDTQTLE